MIKQYFRIIREYWGRVALAVVLGILGVAATMAQPTLIGQLVDGFQSELSNNSLLVAIASLFVFSTIATVLQGWILERTGQSIVFDLRESLLLHIEKVPYLSLQKLSQGQIVSRIVSDVYLLRDVVARGFVEIFLGLSTLMVALVFMIRIDVVLFLIVAGTIAIIIIVVVLIASLTRPAAAKMQECVGELTSHVSVSLALVKTLRTGNDEHELTERSISAAGAARRMGYHLALLRAVVQAVSNISIQVVVVAIIAVGALRVSMDALTLGELSSFVLYAAFAITPVASLAGIISSINEASGAYDRINDILREPSESRRGPVETIPHESSNEIEFNNVSFKYPTGTPVLRGVSFAIPRNKVTAIVGLSGSGKTTIFSLIGQLIDQEGGEILFRGRDTQRINRQSVRENLGIVDQNPSLINDTIFNNLALGNENVNLEKAREIVSCLDLAGNNDDSDGYLDTFVGEGGQKLSGGQRQRITLGRVLLSNNDILLLDEPTSNLDSMSEAAFQRALESHGEGRTIVVIAHRLSTIHSADQIVVLNNGQVEAVGDHMELVRESPTYAEFVRLQTLKRQ